VPEGHTIHRLALDHTRELGGKRVRVASPQGRFDGAELIDGQRFERAEAFGKHLLHRWEGGQVVHVHLGLFGKFFRWTKHPPPPRETTRMRLSSLDAPLTLDLIGPTACELLDRAQLHKLLSRLGPDPLRDDADPERAWARLQKSRSSIGAALMNQAVLAGVGNVYRAEALFVQRIHPERPARDVSRAEFDELWSWLARALRLGVQHRRIITVPAALEATPAQRRRMARTERVHVYKADRCPRCKTAVRRWELAGRWAYACERCQK
jgi:endonuclease-8